MRRIQSSTSVVKDGLFREGRGFRSSDDSGDVFGDIIAGFIPAEDPDGQIKAEVSSGDIITPHFPVQIIDSNS